jgi:multicomponent Na+:H+ antiporter subunit C
MTVLLAVVIGGLFAAALYLMLRRSMARLIVGLALLTNATNLLIFTAGGLTRASPAIVPAGESAPVGPVADPLPQALILTAIVIGFGLLAFTMVLAFSAYKATGTDDLDDLRTTDLLFPVPPRPVPVGADEPRERAVGAPENQV